MAKPNDAVSEVRTVTLATAKREVMVCMKRKRPLFLWGPPGIGKSDVVAQVAREQNRPLIDIRQSKLPFESGI